MKFFVKIAQLIVLLWAAAAFMMCCTFSGFAEELRILTVQGTTPERHLENFVQMIQQKYQVDLEVSVTYWPEPGEIYKAQRNKEADIVSCPHNIPEDSDCKLISGKLVLPVNLDNISNYADVIPALQRPDYIQEQR